MSQECAKGRLVSAPYDSTDVRTGEFAADSKRWVPEDYALDSHSLVYGVLDCSDLLWTSENTQCRGIDALVFMLLVIPHKLWGRQLNRVAEKEQLSVLLQRS